MTEKTVLITGSSRGIGKAAALYLADDMILFFTAPKILKDYAS